MSELKEHLFVPYSELQEGDELTDAITIAKSYYLKSDVDAAIAELKQKLENVNELIKTARQMLEDAKATHYTEMVDAGMRERRLKRAFYKACAEWALSTLSWLDCIDQGNPVKWGEMRRKCLEKMEEFK